MRHGESSAPARKIRTDAEEACGRESGEKGRTMYGPEWERTEEERKVSLVLEQVTKEVGTESITAGALYIFKTSQSQVLSSRVD